MDIPAAQFNKIFAEAVLRPLLEHCAKEVAFIMEWALETNTSGISTTSLQDSVTYDVTAKEAVIYIDYERCQEIYEETPEYEGGKLVEWGRFVNVFGEQAGDNEWNGEIIAFRMAEWLENGAYGSKGNNPIAPTHWFTKIVYNEINKNLRLWIERYFTLNGLKYKRKSTKGA